MEKRPSRAPLIVTIVLLLVPVLYAGSYLVLVVPEGVVTQRNRVILGGRTVWSVGMDNYRYGGDRAYWLYWPLEQIDRKVRPGAWEAIPAMPDDFHSEWENPVPSEWKNSVP